MRGYRDVQELYILARRSKVQSCVVRVGYVKKKGTTRIKKKIRRDNSEACGLRSKCVDRRYSRQHKEPKR